MVSWLRAFVPLAGNPGLVPGTHVAARYNLENHFQGELMSSSGLPWHQACMR